MMIGNCTRGRVLDLFAGSGTSLLACEQIGRVWSGVEVNPLHCDVIVARWEQATGQRAVYATADSAETAAAAA
jgi:site-specific DNA-methyltransferase (adenine-specific)